MFDRTEYEVAMKRAHKSAAECAAAIKKDITTYYRKLNNDGNFTRDEMNTLIVFLKIEDPMNIFFKKELA